MYRQNGTIAKTNYSINDWIVCKDCSDNFGNNASMTNQFKTKTLSNPTAYRGVNTPTLNILKVSPRFDEMNYRLVVTTPGYVCQQVAQSDPVKLILGLDNDEDGSIDSEDLDDDNDGILDNLDDDIDGDGILNVVGNNNIPITIELWDDLSNGPFRGKLLPSGEINDDGSLGERTEFIQHEGSSINPQRQEKAHAHSVNIDDSNTHAYVCDLGMDKVFIYDIDHENRKLNPSQQPSVDEVAGQGPRHFTFHPSGKFVYVLNELGCTITAYDLSANGGLSPIETVGTLPDDWEGDNTTADIHTSPDGNYVYASNRGHHSLVIYQVDSSSGRLRYVGHEQTRGETPRNFAITPDGKFVLAENQDTGTVVAFKRNADGTLEATGSVIDVPAPVCIQFMPVGG